MEEVKFDFEDLKVYQKSLDFIDIIYKITKKFPKEELYILTSQFIRASNSIALNTAEGYGETKPLFLRYAKIAKGSLRECVVCLTISYRQKYISEAENNELRYKLAEISKMLSGLVNYVKSKI
ncbi:MAG: four helix bundle protein [Bacteroidota bacterium]